MISIQQQYPPEWSHCFGCGPQNEHGFQLASHWSGNEATATFQPKPFHCAAPGVLYGGIIAAVIDCHSIATAAAAAHQAAGRAFGAETLPRFVTGSLQVRYLKPTPMSQPVMLRAHAVEIVRRKVIVSCELYADTVMCATGEVVAIQVPDDVLSNIAQQA